MTRFALLLLALPALAHALSSPDGQLKVDVSVNAQQQLVYTVQRAGQPVLLPSRLGLVLEEGDLASGLKLLSTSPVTVHRERYTLYSGKRSQVAVQANEQRFTLANAAGQQLVLTLRAANDGLALRYTVDGPGRKRFKSEATSFAFAPDARAWLQPMSVAKTGWKRTNPSYEEHYLADIPVGTAAPSHAGWVFPALFRTGATWVAVTEAGMDGRFHASRLAADSTGCSYRVDGPEPSEVFTDGALLAETDGPMTTPWRVLAVGPLKAVMESTLGTDLAAPAVPVDRRVLKPGAAAWSWALLKDDATVFDVQRRFIDYAADMRWPYVLVDADWDRKIGDAKMQQLADIARGKGVGLLAWYNSSGAWNDTPYTPKSALLTPADRQREYARMKAIGVKGLKVDFFGGDGASMQAYYVDLLKETAAQGLLLLSQGQVGQLHTAPDRPHRRAVLHEFEAAHLALGVAQLDDAARLGHTGQFALGRAQGGLHDGSHLPALARQRQRGADLRFRRRGLGERRFEAEDELAVVFTEPAHALALAGVEEQMPLVPVAQLRAALHAAHHGKALAHPAAGGAELQRRVVVEDLGALADAGEGVAVAQQRAAAEAADGAGRGRRSELDRRAAVGAGGAVGAGLTTDGHGDGEEQAQFLAEKVANLRIFEDEQGKTNLSILDVKGEAIVVSQFTLYANAQKGRRPSFIEAALPEVAEPLVNRFVELLRGHGVATQTGKFGNHMAVESHNDGPVTIWLEK